MKKIIDVSKKIDFFIVAALAPAIVYISIILTIILISKI